MRLSILIPFVSAVATVVEAACEYQDVGTFAQKVRLSTFKNENCIGQTSDNTKSGFGYWCINFPNNARSFIFSVGTGYTNVNLDRCSIFFYSDNSCEGTKVGESRDSEWKLSKLSAKGKKMASAAIQCTHLIARDEGDGGQKNRKFVRVDDDEWYKDADGVTVKARTRHEAREDDQAAAAEAEDMATGWDIEVGE